MYPTPTNQFKNPYSTPPLYSLRRLSDNSL
nr:MAG TPA: hypothetical protein [Caudoviricetes sp.]